LGALLAQGTPVQLLSLDTYGQHLGLAFQVVDDLLDVSGSEGQVGKRLGKDTDRGKTTYPAVLGEQASRKHAEILVDAACEAIDGFGEAAAPLRDLALFVKRRSN